tara:strand:+ start:182 stop:358 length:177 start_codon:yes stop_codon:yes gene_type:complete
MLTEPPKCIECKHYNDDDNSKNSCKAFKNGIPKEIFIFGKPHTKPRPDDNGVQFEAIK